MIDSVYGLLRMLGLGRWSLLILVLKYLKPGIIPMRIGTIAPTPKTVDPFYKSRAWLEARALALALGNYRCAMCGCKLRRSPQDRSKARPFVDHIVELKDGGAPFDQVNLQPLCGSCHTGKTHKARVSRLTDR